MAVAIEIRRTSQPPTGRKCGTEHAANTNVIVQIPDCCLTRRRIADHKVRMAVVVEISYYGRTSAGDGRRGEVEFRAGDDSSGDEHVSIGQQGRRVIIACGDEAAGGRPSPAGRIVQ